MLMSAGLMVCVTMGVLSTGLAWQPKNEPCHHWAVAGGVWAIASALLIIAMRLVE